MNRRTTTIALAAALAAMTPAAAHGQAVSGATPSAAPSAGPAPVIGIPQADRARMAAEIRKRVDGQAFGWQFAIATNGARTLAGAGGSARSDADTPGRGNPAPMRPTMRYELASLTKNTTAVATMRLLRAKGLTVDSPVGPWLPRDWVLGPGYASSSVRRVTFAQLMSHTSGINQLVQAPPPGTPKLDNTYQGMRDIVAAGTKPNSPRQYRNANYAMLRVLNGVLWRLLGGTIDGKSPAISAETHALYAMDHLRRHVLEPAGIKNVTCEVADTATAGKSYPKGATQSTTGGVLKVDVKRCAGHMGLRLSAMEVATYLSALRAGKIIAAEDLQTMDQRRLGWEATSNLGDEDSLGNHTGVPDIAGSGGVFWHAGDLIPAKGTVGPETHTCGLTFPTGSGLDDHQLAEPRRLGVRRPQDGLDAREVTLAPSGAGATSRRRRSRRARHHHQGATSCLAAPSAPDSLSRSSPSLQPPRSRRRTRADHRPIPRTWPPRSATRWRTTPSDGSSRSPATASSPPRTPTARRARTPTRRRAGARSP